MKGNLKRTNFSVMNHNTKCIWTGKRDPNVKPVTLYTLDRFTNPTKKTFFVLPEYEQELREFNKTFVNYGRSFLIAIFGLLTLLLLSIFIGVFFSFSDTVILISIGVITCLIGGGIMLFPFSTPETAKWFGLKRAINWTRISGFVIILFGIAICFLE